MADQADAVRLNDLYETDFYEWTQQQARLLRERRFADLDLENLIDEVGSVGSSEKREIRNRLTVLIAHLLKWKFQPGRRGESWRETIDEQRRMLLDIIDTSPSLRAYVHERAVEMYRSGRLAAAKETQIAFGVFPDARSHPIRSSIAITFRRTGTSISGRTPVPRRSSVVGPALIVWL